MWIKICGITNLEDARAAVAAGANALGFVFEPRSKRYIGSQRNWQEWVAQVPEGVERVLVVADPSTAPLADEGASSLFHFLQCYAPATEDARALLTILPSHLRLILAFRIAPDTPIEAVLNTMQAWMGIADHFLLDTYDPHQPGGTGKPFDWQRAQPLCELAPLPVILAGGLTPENVRAALQIVRPFGVDVSSGVERAPGKKDPIKVARFIQQARGAG